MGGGISCFFPLFETLFLTWGPHGVPGPLQTHPEVVFRWFGYRFWSFFVAFTYPPQKKKHGGGTARLRTGYAAPVLALLAGVTDSCAD